MASFDAEDDFGKLRHVIAERRAQLSAECIGGSLDPGLYAAICARHDELGQILELIQKIRRGESLRQPAPEPLISDEC